MAEKADFLGVLSNFFFFFPVNCVQVAFVSIHKVVGSDIQYDSKWIFLYVTKAVLL